MTCSMGTKPGRSARGIHRGRLPGTLMRTNRVSRPCGMNTARLSPRLLMNGNGCSESTARGVSIGWMLRAK